MALLYSSVGHGGASGYLAVLSFFSISHTQMVTTALCLNLLVAGIAFWHFHKAGYFSWNLTWPFLISSIPTSFLGSKIAISPWIYAILISGTLMFSAIRLLKVQSHKMIATSVYQKPSLGISLFSGGALGFISGLVGVGGGIFLSPLLILMNWAGAKRVAATSAFFIWINSLAGLLGRFSEGRLEIHSLLIFMFVGTFLGSFLGSKLGACHFQVGVIRKVLASVLFIASLKMLFLL